MFSYCWMETYLGWRFLLLMSVDRDEPSGSRTALTLALTGPLTALLTLMRGVVCAGTAAIVHPHGPVTPCKRPRLSEQRGRVLRRTPCCCCCCCCVDDVTSPERQPLTSQSDCWWTELGRCVFKVGQSLRCVGMRSLCCWRRERVRDAFETLKPCQIGTSPPGPAIWIFFGGLVFTRLQRKVGLKLLHGD